MNAHTFSARRGLAGVLVMLGLAAVACGSSSSTSSPAVRTYVGSAQGTSAFVAVVVDGSRALAYVCDGVPADPVGTSPTVQAWFNGTSDGKTVDVAQGGSRLQLKLNARDMTGTLTLADGRSLPLAGALAAGDAGLYRAETTGSGGKAVGGWILSANGEQRGGVGSVNLSTLSGTSLLKLSQPVFSLQGLATAQISKVGITPIPIP